MLNTKQVSGYTVSEAGALQAARLVRLSNRYNLMLREAYDKGAAVTDDDLDRLQAVAIWAQVAACMSPMPSVEEWLQIPLVTIGELREAAEQLNPAWFVVNTPELEKKSE